MASTNKTTNYELSQFIETDRPAWLTDYNGDMRKLDTALKEVSDTASGASGGIASLTDRMTAAEGAISTNANDIDALEARADTLEAQTQNITGAIGNINTEQIAQNAGIEAATQLGYNLARPYDSASTYAVGDYVLFQNTLYKCVTAVSTGEAFDPTKWLAIKATDEISSGGTTVQIIENSITPGTPTIAHGSISSLSVRRSRELIINNIPLLQLDVDFVITLSSPITGGDKITVPITWNAGTVKPTQATPAYCSTNSTFGSVVLQTAQLYSDQSGDYLFLGLNANQVNVSTTTYYYGTGAFLFVG